MVFFQRTLCLVDVPLAHTVMGIKAIFTGSPSRKMLYGHSHAVRGNSVTATLDPRDNPLKDAAYQLRILPKGAVAALPSGICQYIRHIHISLFHTYAVPFPADAVCKII